MKVWDKDYLLTQVGGDQALVKQLLDMFLNDSPGDLEKLQLAISAKDIHGLVGLSHTLKGTALNLGLNQFAEIAAQIENNGKVGDISFAKDNFPNLNQAFEAVRAELQQYNNS